MTAGLAATTAATAATTSATTAAATAAARHEADRVATPPHQHVHAHVPAHPLGGSTTTWWHGRGAGAHDAKRQGANRHNQAVWQVQLVHVSPNDIYTWAQGPQVGTHLIRAEVSRTQHDVDAAGHEEGPEPGGQGRHPVGHCSVGSKKRRP